VALTKCLCQLGVHVAIKFCSLNFVLQRATINALLILAVNKGWSMKYIGLWTLLLITQLCGGQNSPAIKTQGQTFEDFVPKNWRILQTATGDLNKDKVDDAALVIQEMNSKNVKINDGLGIDTLDTNPRILIILFKDTVLNKFKLREISKTFILNHYSPTMDDPFDGIGISKGILGIGFHFWYNAGSWYQTSVEYKFSFQKNDLFLIGAEFQETHRATMESTHRSFNFSTKKMSETISTFGDELDQNGEQVKKINTVWKKLNIKEMKTLKTLTEPLDWTVLPNISI
jgi:hypothetical protein